MIYDFELVALHACGADNFIQAAGRTMDLQDILARKIKGLPSGPHSDGLRAVRVHIDAAVRHLVRGQTEPDETLFTDVIFRCNQAFEGSIKEAYRVLVGEDPKKKTPYEIETFFGSSKLLREKVLSQFINYRKEWRNPSTHDYTLDFDEDEALLAIVSVTAFSIVLCDQIDSKLAFNAVASGATQGVPSIKHDLPLLDIVAEKTLSFAKEHVQLHRSGSPASDYYRLEGALAGYLSVELANVPGVSVTQNKRVNRGEIDVMVERSGEAVVVELKQALSNKNIRTVTQMAIGRISAYLLESDIKGGVVLLYAPDNRKYNVTSAAGVFSDIMRVISPIY